MNNTIFGDVTTTPIPMSSGGANPDDCASAIKNTVSGKSITLTDVSPIPHKCSCRLTRDDCESKNILNLETADINVGFKNNSSIQDDFLTITYNNDGSITVRGSIPEGEVLMVQAYIRGMIKGKEYTASLRASNNTSIGFEVLGFGANYELIKEYSNNITEHTFTYGDDNVEYYFINSYAISNSNVADLNIGEITFYLQLEEGGQMTEWQPCVLEDSSNDFSTVKVNVNGKTYTPTEDGLVIGIDSISPTMEITTDNPNVKISDFSYSVDTKSYVDNGRHYEYIETITISEEISKLNLTAEPNGTLYNFKKLFMKYTLPKLGAATWWTFQVSGNKNVFGDNMGNTSYETIYRFEAEVENGLLSANYSYHTNHTSNPSNAWKCLAREIKTTPIDSLNIVGAIPVGATFEIWGVRA